METFSGMFGGNEVSVNRSFGGHRFTDEEVDRLLSGGWVKFPATSKKGKEYEAVGHLVMKGRYCDFELDFDNAPRELLVPDGWGGHEFTFSEKRALANGGTVYCTDLVSSRTGKYYAAELEFSEERGRRKVRPVRSGW